MYFHYTLYYTSHESLFSRECPCVMWFECLNEKASTTVYWFFVSHDNLGEEFVEHYPGTSITIIDREAQCKKRRALQWTGEPRRVCDEEMKKLLIGENGRVGTMTMCLWRNSTVEFIIRTMKLMMTTRPTEEGPHQPIKSIMQKDLEEPSKSELLWLRSLSPFVCYSAENPPERK